MKEHSRANAPCIESPLGQRFAGVRAATRALAAPLSAEDCAIQSMPDASPVKGHLAHTTWFFETFVLERQDPCRERFQPAFRVLFNSYYHGVGARHPRPQRGLLSRPSLAEVFEYRAVVDERIASLLRSAGPEQLDALGPVMTLGLHHEQQHQELILTDIHHAF